MTISKKNYITVTFGLGLMLFAGTANIASAQGRSDDHGRGPDHSDNRGRGPEQGYHFRPEDRGQFSSHYKSNLRQVQQHPERRHSLRAGETLPSDYRRNLKSVPRSYYRNVPPPPPGYQFGYYDGYVVAYNPTTRIIADVLDLVNAATR